ncbi:hypothetical protein HPB49_023196 [Dermacentor silvarum]|uniref:Uncharacterized protein n=1 Tax=Dermacentor silvarum TaxID=543639 RepID=A0ACB8C5X1_DERSI|nr:hypothetical protein HPB49_023196 [Dermacentor silvarum]
MVHSIILRPCVEVLWLYIRHQHELLRVVQGDGDVNSVKKARKVQEIRMNLCAISKLKEKINSIWRWSIMVSGAVLLSVMCICTYSIFVEKFSKAQHLFSVIYSVSSAIDFFDIAALSHRLTKEGNLQALFAAGKVACQNWHIIKDIVDLPKITRTNSKYEATKFVQLHVRNNGVHALVS